KFARVIINLIRLVFVDMPHLEKETGHAHRYVSGIYGRALRTHHPVRHVIQSVQTFNAPKGRPNSSGVQIGGLSLNVL
ncbi:hypothetical protein, partial [Hyphomonas beringensis]|uniref:hypothetical protein n=1 Tax=Hyphomonas beringensis TaxID=1280946 RepID=UPI0019D6D10E